MVCDADAKLWERVGANLVVRPDQQGEFYCYPKSEKILCQKVELEFVGWSDVHFPFLTSLTTPQVERECR